jgi:hypothetical protein
LNWTHWFFTSRTEANVHRIAVRVNSPVTGSVRFDKSFASDITESLCVALCYINLAAVLPRSGQLNLAGSFKARSLISVCFSRRVSDA